MPFGKWRPFCLGPNVLTQLLYLYWANELTLLFSGFFTGGKMTKIGEYDAFDNRLNLTKGAPVIWESKRPNLLSVLCDELNLSGAEYSWIIRSMP